MTECILERFWLEAMLFAQKQGRDMLNNLSLSNTYIQCDLWRATIPVIIIQAWGLMQQRICLFVIYIWRCLLHNAGFWFLLGGTMTVQLTVAHWSPDARREWRMRRIEWDVSVFCSPNWHHLNFLSGDVNRSHDRACFTPNLCTVQKTNLFSWFSWFHD